MKTLKKWLLFFLLIIVFTSGCSKSTTEDNGKKMITFYDGDYAELLIDLWPFIVNKVHPAFIKAKKQREKEIKENIKKL